LGFETVARVAKTRQPYQVMAAHGTVVATVDRVDGIGVFAEIERVVARPEETEHARDDIEQVARRLGLDRPEKRSYLSMVLDQQR
jgi:adenylate cyclase class 2